MRNGDYYPARMDQQLEAAQFIINLKRQSNVENSISIMTMSNPAPQVMISLSSDQSKLFHALNSITISGESCNLFSALNVAQLVLKHRQNPNQRQRIILFVGSPFNITTTLPSSLDNQQDEKKEQFHHHLDNQQQQQQHSQQVDDKKMKIEESKSKSENNENIKFFNLAKLFKKNNICIDVIVFGGEQEDGHVINLLNEFVEIIVGGPLDKQTCSDTSSNMVIIPVDGDLSISEAVRASGIVGSQGSMVSNDFGVDPDMDPELAMVTNSISIHFTNLSFLFYFSYFSLSFLLILRL